MTLTPPQLAIWLELFKAALTGLCVVDADGPGFDPDLETRLAAKTADLAFAEYQKRER